MLLEVLSTLVRDLVDLPPPFLGHRPGVSKILEHCQGRVDRTRTRRIGSAEAILELLDDLVAVSWLLGQQTKDHVLEIPLLEDTTCPCLPTATTGPASTPKITHKSLEPPPTALTARSAVAAVSAEFAQVEERA